MSDGTRGGSNDPNLPLIATDDVGGVAYQRVKLDLGGDGLSVPVVGSLPVTSASVLAVSFSSNSSVALGDTMNLDAFGRLRTSNAATLFESSFEYDYQSAWFEPIVASGGTIAHSSNTRSLTLTTPTTSGASAAMQTRQFFPYEKGKSQLIKATFVLGSAVANVRKRVGYFETNNGVYLEQTTDGLRLVLRSKSTGSIVNNEVERAAWNLDPMDGSGPSGLALDVTKQQILVIDAQFLGAGRIRCGFNIDGRTYAAHQFLNANRNAVAPYMQTFSLPVRYEIANTSTSAGGTFQIICCEVESEGGVGSPNGFLFSAANTADVATSSTRAHVLSIRPAATYSGHVNRQVVVPIDIGVIAAGAAVLVEVFYASVLTGGSWGTIANSSVEIGTGQTITTAGTPVEAFFVASGAGTTRGSGSATIDSQYPLVLDAAGANPRALTIAATAVSGTGTARAAINWKEIR